MKLDIFYLKLFNQILYSYCVDIVDLKCKVLKYPWGF